jgi:hypothetical protein
LQFVQTDYETLELRYVRKPGTDRLDRAGLEHYVRGKVGAEFAIVLAPVTEILRGPRAKFLYHLCEVPRPAPKLLAGSGRH